MRKRPRRRGLFAVRTSFSGEAKRRAENLGQKEIPELSSAGDARVKPEHDGILPTVLRPSSKGGPFRAETGNRS
ncbi:hypothetical protein BOSEA31B_13956 [Hyphomicrobiales bacterium]|nr:hypothetical protein BOSEA31B_13956 [Hyphomicrobiales bacterium]CAH1699732.1 hypothetical protein BOSEA1005_12785 [Hyphomicrobiales bacterium]CAI0343463.1 hypothetical protein BO1005MUT1_270072 [Hyphomicrobiales bacterium]